MHVCECGSLSVAGCSVDTITSPTSEHLDNKEQEEGTPKGPLQEQVFAECSRERILGLLAAMLPPAKLVMFKDILFTSKLQSYLH